MIITGDFNMIIENHPFNEFMEMLLFRVLTLFRMNYSGAAHRWEGGGQICPHSSYNPSHVSLLKLGTAVPYLKNIHKIYKPCDTLHEFC